MEKILCLAQIPAFLVFLFFSAGRQIHMAQLNSYRPERLFAWLKEDWKRLVSLRAFFALAAVPISFVSKSFAALFLILALLLCTPYRKAKAKKPLVYTARVKRLFAVCMLLGFVISAGAYFSGASTAVLAFAAVLMPWICMAALCASLPMEAAINRKYINEAKKILAAHERLIVIGVTGSYGKTSMKYALTKLLSQRYSVLMTPGSFNTPMGVVKTVRESLKSTHQIFVVEMGAKNKGDIKEICDIVHPDLGIITSVGPQHLETFKTIENVLGTKLELADAVRQKGGTVFLNIDNPYLKEKCFDGAVTFGTAEGADYRVTELSYSAGGSFFKLSGQELSTSLLGDYSAVNIAGAYAVARTLGVDEADLKAAVKQLRAPEHRLELKRNPRYTVIDDAYNSNPDGARAALKALSRFAERKILVTPGMVELGEKQFELNKKFGAQAASTADYIVLVGEKQAVPIKEGVLEAGFDKERLYVASDINEALAYVYKITDVPSVVLLENDLPDNFL